MSKQYIPLLDNKLLAQRIIKDWESGQDEFEFESSGTTGAPKVLKFNRQQIIWSCEQTRNLLSLHSTDKQLCVLPVNKTGGRMQVFRSLVWNIPLQTEEPDYLLNTRVSQIPSELSLVSLTPMMLCRILQQQEGTEKIKKFRAILIGGGDFQFKIDTGQFPSTNFYHTYGMTESLSHIAVRKLYDDDEFKLLPGTQLRQNIEDQTLEFSNFLTSGSWIKTNDVAEFTDDKSFRIKGRVDNLINSGGIKINPEEIEGIIYEQLDLPVNSFFICGQSDEVLGNKVVLVFDEEQVRLNSGSLDIVKFSNAYLRPKMVIGTEGFLYNEGNKIDRKKTLQKIKDL